MTTIAHSGFSVAARSLRGLLANKIEMVLESNIKIATPYNAAELVSDGQQYLNLFFYHVNYAHDAVGFDGTGICPMTLQCLIIPFGADSDNISAGEHELRLAGEVMRVLHENPRVMLKDPTDEADVAWVQLLPALLTMDELNKIWSLQGNTPYRLSISCEITVVPVQLKQNIAPAKAVSSIELYTYADESPLVKVSDATEEVHISMVRPPEAES